jgi:hypothetical protein
MEFLSSLKTSRLVLGPTQPPIQWVPGTLSPGVKQMGCEAHRSPPSSAKVKNEWSYTSTPPYAFMACTGATLPFTFIFVLHNYFLFMS